MADWYLAAQFSSEQQARDAYFPLLNALKQHGRSVSLFRLKEPYRAVVALCDTPPSKKLEALISSHLAQGKIIPLPKNIVDWLYEKRRAGISQATPMPDSSAFGYEHHTQPGSPFTATIAQAPSGSPLQTGSKVTMRTLPFIIAYKELQAVNITSTWQDSTARSVANLINQVNAACLKSAEKYLFAPSAIRMHASVYQPLSTTMGLKPHDLLIPIGTHVWIELQNSLTTPYGDSIKAVYFYNAYPQAELDRVMPVSRDKYLHDLLMQTYSPQAHRWSLEIITERCDTHIDFTYDERLHGLVWTADHICPVKQCQYPVPPDPDKLSLGVCDPCSYCKQAAGYWFSWLFYALKMVRGDYAITPDQPQWSLTRQEYQQEELVPVGKGKNQRKLKQQVTRHIDYKVIVYDVSIKRSRPAPEIEPHEKRANWLLLAGTGDLIWERRSIPDHTRRYPTRKNGTRQDGAVAVHYDQQKWVPLLRPEKRKATIKKVTAKQFEEKHP